MHGQRQVFLPRTTDGNPIGFVRQSLASDFEPVILTLPQVLDFFDNLDLMRRTMALTDAATALRVSEVLALKWNDLDFIDHLIQVRRAYVDRRFGPPKSKASKAPVPMHPLLAAHLLAWRKETLYPGDEDFVFPSLRLKGKKPPAANMLVADYLRVAARKAGVVAPPTAAASPSDSAVGVGRIPAGASRGVTLQLDDRRGKEVRRYGAPDCFISRGFIRGDTE